MPEPPPSYWLWFDLVKALIGLGLMLIDGSHQGRQGMKAVCQHCHMHAVDDEQHFLFDCPLAAGVYMLNRTYEPYCNYIQVQPSIGLCCSGIFTVSYVCIHLELQMSPNNTVGTHTMCMLHMLEF